MSSSNIIFFLVLLSSLGVQADTLLNPNIPTTQPEENTTYEPSLGVVIGILGIMFGITVVLLIYAKLCHEPAASARAAGPRLGGPSRRFSGIDKTVIESLPFFTFSSLKGSKEGLECAVCLSRFEDVEVLRLLPKCRHAFHVDCVDRWLDKHSTCPLCRHTITSEDLDLFARSNSMRLISQNDDDGDDGMFVVRRDESSAKTKHNHRIVLSGFAFNNRWSDLRSSDLLTLSSEMLNELSAKASFDRNEVGVTVSDNSRSLVTPGAQRSVSEIATFSRYAGSDGRVVGISSIAGPSSLSEEGDKKDERVRKMWLPIATRTIHWFANKDRSQLSQSTQSQTTHV